VENLGQLACLGLGSNGKPVVPVVSHVVTAEGQHGEGVETELTKATFGGSGHLGRNGRANHDTVLPRVRLEDKRGLGLATTAENDGVDRDTAEVVVCRVENLYQGTAIKYE
jgi:hypothetical protein